MAKNERVFQTQFERCSVEEQKEQVDVNLPSLTIPDQSLSIPEILKRYARGQSLGGALDGIYELDENDEGIIMPDLSVMDLAEIEELKRETKERVEELRKQIEESKSEEAEKFRQQQMRKQQLGQMLLTMADDETLYNKFMEKIDAAKVEKKEEPKGNQ